MTRRISSAAVGLGLALAVLGARPAQAQHYSDWTAPINLGSPPNTLLTVDGCGAEFNPSISRDGLSLYFAAGGPGCQAGIGDFDIYVTHRATVSSPWGQPVLLGGNINSTATDNSPTISPDGLVLVFTSQRAGGSGGADLYISWRDDPNDDDSWRPAVNLGSSVNTSGGEQPGGFCADESRTFYLFFASRNIVTSVALQSDGSWGDRRSYPELGQSSGLSIRKDCREIFFSVKASTIDIWTSTRDNTSDPWFAPAKLGPSVNTDENDENRPGLSWDATELYFGTNRTHEIGEPGYDLYVSSRVKLTGQGKDVPLRR